MQMGTKTAIVTGASSGIGLALTQAFLDRGYVVIANARTQSRLKKVQGTLGSPDRFVPVEGDIGRPEVGKRLFEVALERFGHVDVLVNNAGVFIAKPTADYVVDDVEQMISKNLKGFFYPSQQAARHMTERFRLDHQHHRKPCESATSERSCAPRRPHQRRYRPGDSRACARAGAERRSGQCDRAWSHRYADARSGDARVSEDDVADEADRQCRPDRRRGALSRGRRVHVGRSPADRWRGDGGTLVSDSLKDWRHGIRRTSSNPGCPSPHPKEPIMSATVSSTFSRRFRRVAAGLPASPALGAPSGHAPPTPFPAAFRSPHVV